MRPVAASSTQGLPGQERFRSHPVTVVRGDEGAVHVTTRQGRGSRRIDPQYRPPVKLIPVGRAVHGYYTAYWQAV